MFPENSDVENGLIINRNDALKTLAITQTVLENQNIEMHHYDLIEGQKYSLALQKNPKSQSRSFGTKS